MAPKRVQRTPWQRLRTAERHLRYATTFRDRKWIAEQLVLIRTLREQLLTEPC